MPANSWARCSLHVSLHVSLMLSSRFLPVAPAGRDDLFDAGMQFWYVLMGTRNFSGIYCMGIHTRNGECTDPKMTIGSAADSMYEYMLKQWVLSNHTQEVRAGASSGYARCCPCLVQLPGWCSCISRGVHASSSRAVPGRLGSPPPRVAHCPTPLAGAAAAVQGVDGRRAQVPGAPRV